jgi:hypothetical protein
MEFSWIRNGVRDGDDGGMISLAADCSKEPSQRPGVGSMGGELMTTFKPIAARLGRVSLAFSALISIAAVATPATPAPDNGEKFSDRVQSYYYYPNNNNNYHHHHHRYRHNDNDGFFSFGLGGGPVYSDPPYYYAPPPQYYYPPPAYYQPGPSFNLTIPLGN